MRQVERIGTFLYMTQKTFADLNWELKQKKTRREGFLEEMAVAVPWCRGDSR